jgi:hypothetical protein
VYEFLIIEIFLFNSFIFSISILISLAVFYEISNSLIKVSLSKIVSAFASANNLSTLSSEILIDFSPLANFYTFASLLSSTSLLSFLTTSAKSCSSSPSKVTVKFITLTLMKTSGK